MPGTMVSEYTLAIQGSDLYNYYGNRVVQSKTTAGKLVVVKVKPICGFLPSEAEMMNFASQQAGILAPQVFACYEVDPQIIAMVSDLCPGVPLDQVWGYLDKDQKMGIKKQLAEQIRLWRKCTRPYIGRINRQEIYNFYDPLHYRSMGPFDTEEEFDNWCLGRIKSPWKQSIWKRLLPGMRKQLKPGETQQFVLTHGDLHARNIIVNEGRISGIVDWEYSGFFPEYMEYALAMEVHDCIEDWWRPVLKQILDPCGIQRAKFASAITNRGL